MRVNNYRLRIIGNGSQLIADHLSSDLAGAGRLLVDEFLNLQQGIRLGDKDQTNVFKFSITDLPGADLRKLTINTYLEWSSAYPKQIRQEFCYFGGCYKDHFMRFKRAVCQKMFTNQLAELYSGASDQDLSLRLELNKDLPPAEPDPVTDLKERVDKG